MDIDPPSTYTTTSPSSFPFNSNPPSKPFSPFPFASTSTSPYPSYPRTQPNQPYITLANNANTNFHIAHPNPDPNLSPWSNEATDVDMQDVGADFSEMLSAPVPTSPSMSMRASANASAGAGAGDAFQTNPPPFILYLALDTNILISHLPLVKALHAHLINPNSSSSTSTSASTSSFAAGFGSGMGTGSGVGSGGEAGLGVTGGTGGTGATGGVGGVGLGSGVGLGVEEGRVQILIPYAVLSELDGLTKAAKHPPPPAPAPAPAQKSTPVSSKHPTQVPPLIQSSIHTPNSTYLRSRSKTGEAARDATAWLLGVGRKGGSRAGAGSGGGAGGTGGKEVVGMRFQRRNERPVLDKPIEGDMRILECCQYFSSLFLRGRVVLWTDDRNLRLQAEVHEIKAVGAVNYTLETLLKAVDKLYPNYLNMSALKHTDSKSMKIKEKDQGKAKNDTNDKKSRDQAQNGGSGGMEVDGQGQVNGNGNGCRALEQKSIWDRGGKRDGGMSRAQYQQQQSGLASKSGSGSKGKQQPASKGTNNSTGNSKHNNSGKGSLGPGNGNNSRRGSTTSNSSDVSMAMSASSGSSRRSTFSLTKQMDQELAPLFDSQPTVPNLDLLLSKTLPLSVYSLLLKHVASGDPVKLRQFLTKDDPGPSSWDTRHILYLVQKGWEVGMKHVWKEDHQQYIISAIGWFNGFLEHYTQPQFSGFHPTMGGTAEVAGMVRQHWVQAREALELILVVKGECWVDAGDLHNVALTLNWFIRP